MVPKNSASTSPQPRSWTFACRRTTGDWRSTTSGYCGRMSCPALFGWCAALCAHLSTLTLDPTTGEKAMKRDAICDVLTSLCEASEIIFHVGLGESVDSILDI